MRPSDKFKTNPPGKPSNQVLTPHDLYFKLKRLGHKGVPKPEAYAYGFDDSAWAEDLRRFAQDNDHPKGG